MALVANDHALASKEYLEAEDFRDETLITYPVEESMLDILQLLLKPAGVNPSRRTTELTVAILMLVATRRGIAVLPRWAVQNYLQRQYVTARPITREGLFAEIWAATLTTDSSKPYIVEFIELIKATSAATLMDIEPID